MGGGGSAIQPTQFQDFVQLFSLVIYCECSNEHLLRDKWCGVKNTANGHTDSGADSPFLKVMTSRHQVTDIWMFVISVELSRHFHPGQLCFDAAASSLPPSPPYILKLRRVVHTGLAGGKTMAAKWATHFLNCSFCVCCSLKLSVPVIDWCCTQWQMLVATQWRWAANALPWHAAAPATASFIFAQSPCWSLDIHQLIIITGTELCNSAPCSDWMVN